METRGSLSRKQGTAAEQADLSIDVTPTDKGRDRCYIVFKRFHIQDLYVKACSDGLSVSA